MAERRSGADAPPAGTAWHTLDRLPEGTSAGSPLDPTTRETLGGVARSLQVPVALLSRGLTGWRFEGEAFPGHSPGQSEPVIVPNAVEALTGRSWTGVFVGHVRRRDWMLVMPGHAEAWRGATGLEEVIERVERSLEDVEQTDEREYFERVGRRLYAFSRRLARAGGGEGSHGLILRGMASIVGATTGSFATYHEPDQALAITATLGYPRAIVEHLRIRPGVGVIGKAFLSRRAVIGRADPQAPRRLRYRTDSYLAVPLVASGRVIGVVTLTDRRDGRAFEPRDLTALRLFAPMASLAIDRDRISGELDDLTRAATVDPVTGLFNRRHFEARVVAEVQRARRQQQDLALMMVDIDDFKRINDTFGHQEGDRALREVADLLRSGVRIFDVCARYGGEEFAIVMPGASEQMAIHVAERIRAGIHERSSLDPLPITVSIGVGFLRPHDSADQLIASADAALISAKRAGKNVVKAQERDAL
jgi:diguanylate cyclase (GGDEF)-like protein